MCKLLCSFGLLASQAFGALSFQSSTKSPEKFTGTYSYSVTISSCAASHGLLVVFAFQNTGTQSLITGATWNTTETMTAISGGPTGGNTSAKTFYLLDPTATTANVTVVGGGNDNISEARVYCGVSSATPIDTAAYQSAQINTGTNNISVTVTASTAGNWLVGFAAFVNRSTINSLSGWNNQDFYSNSDLNLAGADLTPNDTSGHAFNAIWNNGGNGGSEIGFAIIANAPTVKHKITSGGE